MPSEQLVKVHVDCETGTVTTTPLTLEEIAFREMEIAQFAEQRAREQEELEIKAAKKQELLQKLGITEEEALLLLS